MRAVFMPLFFQDQLTEDFIFDLLEDLDDEFDLQLLRPVRLVRFYTQPIIIRDRTEIGVTSENPIDLTGDD